MIKAICFDLDGVYFNAAGFSSFKSKLIDLGADKDLVNEQFHGPAMEQFKKGVTTENDYWADTIHRLGLEISTEEIKRLLISGYTVNPIIKRVVNDVRKQGYKTCICSNDFRTRIEGLDNKFDFLKNFDACVFSCDAGILKPSKKIYEKLLGQLNIQPEELVYSDDNEEKLFGAKELGINTFAYVNDEQFVEELSKLGVELS